MSASRDQWHQRATHWRWPDGNLGTGDDVVLASTTTANSPAATPGFYQFTGVAPGNYRVRFGNLAGGITYGRTAANLGVDTNDSDADPTTGETATITLAAAFDSTVDAGLFRPISIGDRVWFDANGDGVQDAGEPGIVGATVSVVGFGPDGLTGTADDVAFLPITTGLDGIWTLNNRRPESTSRRSAIFRRPDGRDLRS